MSNICACVSGKNLNECISQIRNANLSELRLDLVCIKESEIIQLMKHCKNWIITIRHDFLLRNDYLSIFKSAISCNPKYVDVDFSLLNRKEVKNILRILKNSNIEKIFSFHDYEKTPDIEFLESKTQQMFKEGADVVKFACTANSMNDNLKILSLYSKYQRIIAFNMGQSGKISRILSLYFGEKISYAVSEKEYSVAQGQLTFSEIESIHFQVIKILNLNCLN